MRAIVFVCLLLVPHLALSQAKRAQSLIDKGKIEEAFRLLNRVLTKDSLAAAEKYVLATLYFDQNYAKNDLDSAYHYILIAIKSFAKTVTVSTVLKESIPAS